MVKIIYSTNSRFCVEDISNLAPLLEMFAETAEIEGDNKKTAQYEIVIKEITE